MGIKRPARVDRSLFLGFIQLHIIYHATLEPVCGVDLARELATHGYSLSPGTLYPTLHALAREGYLEQERRTVAGRHRKYYRATPSGRRALRDGRARARELLDEIAEEPEDE